MEGKIRKIFPGANTANGSFNFFDKGSTPIFTGARTGWK